MKKELFKSKTPQSTAQYFWKSLYRKIGEKLEKGIKEDKGTPEEKKHYNEFLTKLKSLPPDEPVGSLKQLENEHRYLVKPYLNWNKIRKSFKNIDIDDKTIELIIFILKPKPIEQILIPAENPLLMQIGGMEKSIIKKFNQKIKELSPLVKKLENLKERDEAYRNFEHLSLTIEALKWDIAVYREIIKRKQDNDKKYYRDYIGLDKDILKSPQKHKYWNGIVSNAIEILKPYFHTDSCNKDSKDNINCRKTHEKTYMKIAELLKILYPSIWKEGVYKIASRIKQKDYRGIQLS